MVNPINISNPKIIICPHVNKSKEEETYLRDVDMVPHHIKHKVEFAFNLGDLVYEKLKEQKRTASDLAMEMGISKSALSQLLNGGRNLTIDTIGRIEEALGCYTLHQEAIAKSSNYIPQYLT